MPKAHYFGDREASMSHVNIPGLRIVSESNAHEHWRKRQKRAKEQRGLVCLVLRSKASKPTIPCTIRLTRIAPRKLDQGNIAAALKHAQDGCADWLGIDDRRDDLVKYEYLQEQVSKTYGLRIEIVEAIK
jgi:hypothetical protein